MHLIPNIQYILNREQDYGERALTETVEVLVTVRGEERMLATSVPIKVQGTMQ